MAASYSSLGQYDKAHEIVTKILRINPTQSIDAVIIKSGYKQKTDLEDLIEPLRKAGLPEHSPKKR